MRSQLSVVALLAAVASCHDATSPNGQLGVDVTTSSSIVRPDAPVTISVTVTNRGDNDVTIETSGCPDRFAIVTVSGIEVGPPDQPCLAITFPKTLHPQEQWTYRSTWGGLARGPTWDAPVRLAAGYYAVVGAARIIGSSDESTLAHSSPVAIRLQD